MSAPASPSPSPPPATSLRFERVALVALLAIHAVILAWGAATKSPTLNEPGHLVAGISYWMFNRFDVYSVNPPLVRLVAALPVMAAGCETDWKSFYSGPGARPEMAMGQDFCHANGRRTFFLMTLARLACIPFALLGGERPPQPILTAQIASWVDVVHPEWTEACDGSAGRSTEVGGVAAAAAAVRESGADGDSVLRA